VVFVVLLVSHVLLNTFVCVKMINVVIKVSTWSYWNKKKHAKLKTDFIYNTMNTIIRGCVRNWRQRCSRLKIQRIYLQRLWPRILLWKNKYFAIFLYLEVLFQNIFSKVFSIKILLKCILPSTGVSTCCGCQLPPFIFRISRRT